MTEPAELEHWLNITQTPDWERQHITDPNIPIRDTLAAITRAFPPWPRKILEIGCGTGRLTRRIAKLYPNAIIIGTDINTEILTHNQATQRDTHIFYLHRQNLDNFEGFDTIYSVAVFQHLTHTDQRAYIRGAYQALKLGGSLRIQFIDGEDSGTVADHKTPLKHMEAWFQHAGFTTHADYGLAHPQWTWITGIKPWDT